jgi:hypothetical protein
VSVVGIGDGTRLSVKKFRGDRVRFLDYEHADAYREAYPETDRDRTFVVLGREEIDGAIRLRVDAPPHYVWPRDVRLDWASTAERRAALLAAGHSLK